MKIFYRLIRSRQPSVESNVMRLSKAGFANLGNGLDRGTNLFLEIANCEPRGIQRAAFL